jgi:hypothetical protein
VQRRQRELGGGQGPISTRQVWLRGGGDEHWSYEIVRKIVERGHSNIGDRVADRLAIALNVPVSKIHEAAGQRQRGVPFQLPPRSAQLTQTERNILRAVMDAMLGAYAEDRLDEDDPPARPRPRSVTRLEIPEPDFVRGAARRGRSRGKETIRAQDADAESPHDDSSRGD